MRAEGLGAESHVDVGKKGPDKAASPVIARQEWAAAGQCGSRVGSWKSGVQPCLRVPPVCAPGIRHSQEPQFPPPIKQKM